MHTLIEADARHIPLEDRSVHMCVTSPPYWGLRDYGTSRWEGGDEGCDHTAVRRGHGDEKQSSSLGSSRDRISGDACGKCGARRVDRQLGLESTLDAFVAAMVAVFREVWRVLRDDGTCWINLGDSYASNSCAGRKDADIHRRTRGNPGDGLCEFPEASHFRGVQPGLKPKDLIGIPWRVALALQADGWYLRSDIIWAKPNPMPESVIDRPTKSHEYLFLMSKNEHYYYDADAVREEAEYGRCSSFRGGAYVNQVRGQHNSVKSGESSITSDADPDAGRNLRSVFRPEWDDDDWLDWIEAQLCGGGDLETLWDIPTESYRGAHFATFPRKLVEPCVKAGTSEKGCCPMCGAGWRRVVERELVATRGRVKDGGTIPHRPENPRNDALDAGSSWGWTGGVYGHYETSTLGWRPDCECFGHFEEIDDEPENPYAKPRRIYVPDGPQPDPVPAIVLDPFCGVGTTLVVAEALGRNGVGLDLSREYLELAKRRIERPHARVPRPGRPDESHPLFDAMVDAE